MKKVPIKCNETNIIYSSAIEASKAMNLNVKSISKVLNGKLKKTGGYTFIKVKDDTAHAAANKSVVKKTSKPNIININLSNIPPNTNINITF